MSLDERHRLHDQPYEIGEQHCEICAHDQRRRGRRIAVILCLAACVTIWAWSVAS